jgi:hypothetical protein
MTVAVRTLALAAMVLVAELTFIARV